MSVSYLRDSDGSLTESVAALSVVGAVGGSPVGRLRGLDAATGAVYEAIRAVLTGQVGITDPVEFEAELADLTEQLGDLDTKTRWAFDLAVIACLTGDGGGVL